MSGSSQQDSTSRGDEIWSVLIHVERFLWGWYEGSNQWRLMVAIKRLWVVVLVHRSFWGDRRVVGRSIIVGRRIFSIVGGLDYVDDRIRGFVWRRLVWLGRCLLHRLRMLV